MAAGTLLVLDASLPGGLIFPTLVLFSLFTVFNLALTSAAPFLQQAFSTVALSAGDWLVCAAVASSVLLLREFSKVIT